MSGSDVAADNNDGPMRVRHASCPGRVGHRTRQRSCSRWVTTLTEAPWASVKHAVTSPRRIAALDARGNRPAGFAERQPVRDADQHRPPDSAAVRDRRLLGLPARARSRQPGAGGDDRPAARKRRPRADAAHRRAGRAGGRAAPAAVVSPTRRCIRASSTSARRARIRTARSSACRSSIAACCRACWSCRRSSRASSRRTTCACW